MKVLLIDNYDSFTFNIYQLLGELGAEVSVVRNDEADIQAIEGIDADAIVISPGPGNPANPRDFGICAEVLTTVSKATPTLGVCLGHQGFAHCYGARVVHAPRLMHGKASMIFHDGRSIYEGMENPFMAGRYHSLIVEDDLPREIEVTARTTANEVMGIRHSRYPIEGVQFHPESILTPKGGLLLGNFLAEARR